MSTSNVHVTAPNCCNFCCCRRCCSCCLRGFRTN